MVIHHKYSLLGLLIENDDCYIPLGYYQFTIIKVDPLDLDHSSDARYKIFFRVEENESGKIHNVTTTVYRFDYDTLDAISKSVGLMYYRRFLFEPEKIEGKSGKFKISNVKGDKRIDWWFRSDVILADARVNFGDKVVLYDNSGISFSSDALCGECKEGARDDFHSSLKITLLEVDPWSRRKQKND